MNELWTTSSEDRIVFVHVISRGGIFLDKDITVVLDNQRRLGFNNSSQRLLKSGASELFGIHQTIHKLRPFHLATHIPEFGNDGFGFALQLCLVFAFLLAHLLFTVDFQAMLQEGIVTSGFAICSESESPLWYRCTAVDGCLDCHHRAAFLQFERVCALIYPFCAEPSACLSLTGIVMQHSKDGSSRLRR